MEGAGEHPSLDEVAKAQGVDKEGYLLVLRKKNDKLLDAMEAKDRQVPAVASVL